MKKWFAEEFAFTITVTGFLQSEQTENYCRNGEEIEIATAVPMVVR